MQDAPYHKHDRSIKYSEAVSPSVSADSALPGRTLEVRLQRLLEVRLGQTTTAGTIVSGENGATETNGDTWEQLQPLCSDVTLITEPTAVF